MNYFILFNILFFFYFNSHGFAETIYVHPPSLSEDGFQSAVFQLRGTTLTNYLSQKYSLQKEFDVTSTTDAESLKKLIQEIEAGPILRSEAEVLTGLYQKLNLLDEKSVPLSRVAGLFSAHPELQDYYFDYWNKIKAHTKITKISDQNKKDLLELIERKNFLLIDGKIMDPEKINSLSALPHQWILFSNAFLPIVYTGTANGFLYRSKDQIEIPNLCMHEVFPFPKFPNFKITILNQESLCSEIVQKNPLNSIRHAEKGFYEKNKNWLVPTGFVVGFLAIASMKDKKMTIKFPSLSF